MNNKNSYNNEDVTILIKKYVYIVCIFAKFKDIFNQL